MRAGFLLTGVTSGTLLACSIDLAPLAEDEVSQVKPTTAGSGGSGASSGSGASPGSGGVGGGSGVGGGGFGGSGASANACSGYCDHSIAAACNSETKTECVASCESALAEFATTFPECHYSYSAWLACAATSGTFVCSNGEPVLSNCAAELDGFAACWSVPISCSITASAPSGGSCYALHDCNPLLDDCPSGEACDWYTTSTGVYALGCFPDVSAGLCAPCGTADSPICAPGLGCVPSGGYFVCAAYCCNDADCGGVPGSCRPWGNTGLSFCGV